jgi:tetratricopeptide (TPR) repeat protein
MPTPNQTRETEAWDLLRQGQTDEALPLLREECSVNRSNRASLGYGAALMWAGEYKTAVEHFEGVIETSRATKPSIGLSEDHYSLGGAGRWCLGDYTQAVKLWRLGTQAPYAIYGIGLECPRLLALAAILSPALCDQTKALELLKKRASDPRVHGYPGTLAQFILGIIDNETLEASLVRSGWRYTECSNRDHKWKAAFYRAVLDLERSTITRAAFGQLVESLAEFSQFDDLDSTEFWWMTRYAEFYIARHEALLRGSDTQKIVG